MGRYKEAYDALGAVVDPELDEPITDLGFVRSLTVTPAGNVKVHLRLPTSFCSPNFAYLMASDAKDVLMKLGWARRVVVELDDHHDSAIINTGLAADAGYRGTFGHEADESLDELRETFRRKAHTAAMERCLTGLLRVRSGPHRGIGRRRDARRPTRRRRHDGASHASPRPRIVHGARRSRLGRPSRPELRTRRGADGAADGQVDPDLHRRKCPLLSRPVAHPLRRRTTRVRRAAGVTVPS